MNSSTKTNDSRLANHLLSIFRISKNNNLSFRQILNSIDLVYDLPVSFSDAVVVYETFPVFGELMFPKPRSHLWQLLSTTDSYMLLTDSFLTGKDSLFLCRAFENPADAKQEMSLIVNNQSSPTVCLKTYKGISSIAFPLTSISSGKSE
jgi:hypothetical protein